jgi:hypothetical protein
MIILIKPENLSAEYELAITAHPAALRAVIERRLRGKTSVFLRASMAKERQAISKPDDLVQLTKRTWGAFLGRGISDQEAHIIISAFCDLGSLLKEIREVDNATNN